MIFAVENGCFGYRRGSILLRDISFRIEPGEVLAVLGANGAGKTTMLRCMMGFLPWRDGGTFIDGRELSSFSPRQIWRKMAYVPQARTAGFPYTAYEMTLLGRSAHLGAFKQPGPDDERIAMECMEETGILHLKDKPCNRMSGGELQMVLIARALTTQPSLLVMDEPESNLDFHNQLVILEVIRHLAHDLGKSVVLNTHFPDHAMRLADKALLLNRDGTNLYGPVNEVVTVENIRSAFGVHAAIRKIEDRGELYDIVVPLSLA
ncbi:ABC transporter ATP-binding protein [Fretibacterium fastidiosum]|uniref:ABC-type cobalamin/Fe3+-siderophores transport systems, ATPase components n=1 Tax=Fretibacterium fastidiosum TaxID=651822 RepID=A0AB94IYG6_9BACT|nr:ABC transporter ATP-binding protein [Fretibacterium fastidiosum]CBL28719.1 ABC-type cobalamin/Fe3+-siderophores transport systems, ATPase components [Fretibacterium fastidiosum]